MLAHTVICTNNPYVYTKKDLQQALDEQREEFEEQLQQQIAEQSVPHIRPTQRTVTTAPVQQTPQPASLASNSLIKFN
jgi:hypothetical protein